MRWILRLVVVWGILAAIGYWVGLPYAAKLLQTKTRTDTITQCQQQLAAQGMTNVPNAPVSAEQAGIFCHCLADSLTVTREDLLEVVDHYIKTGKQEPPARIRALMQTQVNTCNTQLQQSIMHHPSAPQAAPARNNEGETIIFK